LAEQGGRGCFVVKLEFLEEGSMRVDMVVMKRLLGMADYNVKQMAMLLGDLLQNSSGKRYGVNCWRILEMGSCSALVRRAQFCFCPPMKIRYQYQII